MLGKDGAGRLGGREVAHCPWWHKLDLTFASTWVLAPESNPADVKGEGTRKNNMEITWTVRVPLSPLMGPLSRP